MRKHLARTLCLTLIMTTTALIASPDRGWASLAPSGIVADASAPGAVRDADMKVIATALESKLLSAKLKALGLDEAETQSRLSKLSDREIHQLASSIDAVHPGGLVVELLVVVVLVLLIVYLLKRV
ncbi:MAG: PA2779 family protein [Elusimicrobiota bacterium]|nr:PA2779 family protein [Elusimicrobiota bacterium]